MNAVLVPLMLSVALLAQAKPAVDAKGTNTVRLEVFVREDSDACKDAAALAKKLGDERAGLKVVVSDIVADEVGLKRFWDLARHFKIEKPGLPAFYTCGQFKIGFQDASASESEIASMLAVRAFVREGCPHCRDAKKFFVGLKERWPAVRVELFDVAGDASARQAMQKESQRYGKSASGLPVIVFGGRMITGYTTDATTGKQIEDLLRSSAVKETKQTSQRVSQSSAASMVRMLPWAWFSFVGEEELASQGAVAPPPPPGDVPPPPPPGDTTSDPLDLPPLEEPTPAEIDLPIFGPIRVADWGFPTFTIIIGLIDGFNPCAMWVLVFLLSVLVNVRSRVRILAIAGTFVLVSGLAYFAFMAAWLNVYMLIGLTRPLQIGLGLFATFIGVVNVKDFFAFKRGLSLSIPESAKPGIYQRVRSIVAAKYLSVAVGAAVVLAVAVNTIELVCTAGLPALYTQILTMQEFPTWKNYAFLALYNAAYMFDDALLLSGFVFTLSRRKLQEREGRWLKLISGVVVLALGLTMLFAPEWLHVLG